MTALSSPPPKTRAKASTRLLPILPFPSATKWSVWLAKNHAKSDGIWLQFFKKDSNVKTVTYAEALDEALCYGWIDGQMKKHDAQSWLHRFTPRRPRSMWSKRNTEHVARLTREGRMMPAGLAQVSQAQADGRWQVAYDAHSTMTLPDDFLDALARNKKSKAFFETLNKTNRYSIAWRLQTARTPETRAKRMTALLDMLRRGESIHPNNATGTRVRGRNPDT